MFHPMEIRKYLTHTAAISKSIFQQISLLFIPKSQSFYHFILSIVSNIFTKEEEPNELLEKYSYTSQQYKFTNQFDMYSKLNSDYVHNHKIYNNYAEISEYKIVDNDRKFFLNKIYKNKSIHVKTPLLSTNIILDDLFYLKQKLKLEFGRKSVSGQVVINKYYFFKTYWLISLQEYHKITKKVINKPIQKKSFMNLILLDLPKINKTYPEPYKNKKLFKKLFKKKTKKKKYYLDKTPPTFSLSVSDDWLKFKRKEPLVTSKKKKTLKSIYSKDIIRSGILKSKHMFSVKNVIKLQKIALKSNNYELFNSLKYYKKLLYNSTSQITAVQPALIVKKKYLNNFISKNKYLRIRWNNNAILYNKFISNIFSAHNQDTNTQLHLLFKMYLKKKWKYSPIVFKNLKKLFLSTKSFKLNILKKNKKKTLKRYFSNKVKKLLYIFYKFVKKNKCHTTLNSYYISKKNETFITFYKTYSSVIHKLRNVICRFKKDLSEKTNDSMINLLKQTQIKINTEFLLNKNSSKTAYKKSLSWTHVKNSIKQLILFSKKNNFLKTSFLFKNYFFLKDLSQVFFNYPCQFNNLIKYAITQDLNTNQPNKIISQQNNKFVRISSNSAEMLKVLKRKLSKLCKSHWLSKNKRKKILKLKKLNSLHIVLKNIKNIYRIQLNSNKLKKIKNYIENKINIVSKNCFKLNTTNKSLINLKKNYHDIEGYCNMIRLYAIKSKKNIMKGVFNINDTFTNGKRLKLSNLENFSYNFLKFLLTADTELKKNSLRFKLFFMKEFSNIIKYSQEFQLKKLYRLRFKFTKFLNKNKKTKISLSKAYNYLHNASKKKKYHDARYTLKILKKKTKTIKNPKFKNPSLLETKTKQSILWEDRIYKKWIFLRYKNTIIDNLKLIQKKILNRKKILLFQNKYLNNYFFFPFSEPIFTRKWKKATLSEFSQPVVGQILRSKRRLNLKKKLKKKHEINLLKKFKILSNYKKKYLKKKMYLYLRKKKAYYRSLGYRKQYQMSKNYRKANTLFIRKKTLKKFTKVQLHRAKLLMSRVLKKIKIFLKQNSLQQIIKYPPHALLMQKNAIKKQKIKVLNSVKSNKNKFNHLFFFFKNKRYIYNTIHYIRIRRMSMKEKTMVKKLKKIKLRINNIFKLKKINLRINNIFKIKNINSKNPIIATILRCYKNITNTRLKVKNKINIESQKSLKKKIGESQLLLAIKSILNKTSKCGVSGKTSKNLKLANNSNVLIWKKLKKNKLIKKQKNKESSNKKILNKNLVTRKNSNKKNLTLKNKKHIRWKRAAYKRVWGEFILQAKQQTWLNKKLSVRKPLTRVVLLNTNKIYTNKRIIAKILKELKERQKKVKIKSIFDKKNNLIIKSLFNKQLNSKTKLQNNQIQSSVNSKQKNKNSKIINNPNNQAQSSVDSKQNDKNIKIINNQTNQIQSSVNSKKKNKNSKIINNQYNQVQSTVHSKQKSKNTVTKVIINTQTLQNANKIIKNKKKKVKNKINFQKKLKFSNIKLKPKAKKKKMTKTWTYNDIVRLNLGYLKPNTNSYKHSEVLKSFLSKIDKKQTKRYNAFLTQYINADAKKYNEKKAKNTLIKLQSQWNYIQYNAISEKKKIKKKSKITVWPLIFVKTARSKLKNSLKIKNKNINNFQNPKELTHLLNTILTFSNKNKTATTSVKCQPIKSLNFFFEKKKKILPNRFAMTRSAIREERLNSQRIKYIKNYGHTKRINTKKNKTFIKKKFLSKNKLSKLYFSKKFKRFINLFIMINKKKFLNVSGFKFLHTPTNSKKYRQIQIKYSLSRFKRKSAPEISHFMSSLKIITGLVRTKYNNNKHYRLKKILIKKLLRKKKKIKLEEARLKKIRLKKIAKLPKLPKLLKPKKPARWKRLLLSKPKVKKVKIMHLKKRLKRKQRKKLKKIIAYNRINNYKLNKKQIFKPQDLTTSDLKKKKKIFQLLVQIKKNNLTKAMYIISKSKSVLTTKKKKLLSLVIHKSYFYKLYNRLYIKNIFIKNLKIIQSSDIFKIKFSLLKKKEIFKTKSKTFLLKELVFLNNLVKTSPKHTKVKKKKIIYKSLIKNINNKLWKDKKANSLKLYAQLHKVINRQISNAISKHIHNNISADEVLINEKKLYNRFFLRSRVIFNLKLHKKLRVINHLVQAVKKHKKVNKKKIKKIKKKLSNYKKLTLKRHHLLKKNIVLISKYNSLHNIPIINIKLNIRNFLFLNKPAYESSILNFYFKTITTKTKINKKNKKTLFFNFRNKKLTTYRKARQLHWSHVTHKTLNKRKYSKFIKNWVKNLNTQWNTFKTHCMFKFNFSHQFWENFILLYRFIYNKALEFKTVSQLPIHTTFWWFLNLQKKLIQKVSLKLNFWQEKKIRIKKTFWMEQKKNLPKFIKKKLFRLYKSLSALHYDYITNSFIMLKNIKQPIHNNLYFINNKLLKLHDFKYNS